MIRAQKHIVITGAAGYIGSRLATRVLAEPNYADARVTLVDLRLPAFPSDERVRLVQGDLSDKDVMRDLIGTGVDVLFHMAGVLGGAAEADYPLSRRINIDATLNLFESVRDTRPTARVVFASSTAVFGPPLLEAIDDATIPSPTMSYGAQKRMMEVALEQFSARGWLDGLALRLPGVVARRDADARMKAAFFNSLFFAFPSNKDIEIPVSPDGTTWLLSVGACIESLILAACIPTERLGRQRAVTLPAQWLRIDELVAALRRRYPESKTQIQYSPDSLIEAQFARLPKLTTALADSLGFRHDGSIDELVRRALT